MGAYGLRGKHGTKLVEVGRKHFRTGVRFPAPPPDQRMKRFLLPLIFLAFWAVLPAMVPAPAGGAESEAERICYLLELEGSINPVTKDYLLRGISQAGRDGVETLIIQLDTPGGLESSMKEIVKAIFSSEVPIIVWVGPAGSRAASAGVFITMAADLAAMAPGTNIGAAHPVALGGGSPGPGPESKSEEASPMEEKIVNDAAAFARGVAEKRGRNGEWAEEAVRKSVSITSSEALELRVIDLIAGSLNELLQKVDGYPLGAREALAALRRLELEEGLEDLILRLEEAVAGRKAETAFTIAEEIRGWLAEFERTGAAGAEMEEGAEKGSFYQKQKQGLAEAKAAVQEFISSQRVLWTAEAEVRELPMTLRERLLNYLADPNVVYILLMLGIYGLIYEFFSPGLGFGLAAGGLSLLLAFMGLQILPINLTGLALILFGVLLMVLDAFTPTNGILTTGGVISLLLGSFTLFNIQSPALRLSWWNILLTVGTLTLLFVFVISKGLLIQRKPAATGVEGMIGAVGVAREDLAPEGLVSVRGELWKAVSIDGSPIGKGEEVSVEGVAQGRLRVRRTKREKRNEGPSVRSLR